ncbi:MAG TPA: RDD family protein [Acidimicrobiales bacterium]
MSMLPEDPPRPQQASDFPSRGPNSLASIPERGAARLIDLLIELVPVLIIFIVWALRSDPRVDAFPRWPLFVFIVGTVAYETGLVGWRGQSLGKFLVGVRVARLLDGAKPDSTWAAMRVLVPCALLAIPVVGAGLYLFVYLWAMVTPMRRGMHDAAAGTVVVRAR